MNLWERLRGGDVRSAPIGSVDDYLGAMAIAQFQGAYSPGLSQTLGGEPAEKITTDFAGMAGQVFGRNSVVFACMLARLSVFSQVRFQWQKLNQGRPSELFGTSALSIFEEPWPGGTTADLLARMILDADLAGNSYWTEQGGELVRLRPDWTDIVLESRVVGRSRKDELQVLGSRKIGYLYHEGGRRDVEPVILLPDEVAHYCPLPDPMATFRGMSWLSPLVREIVADESMTRHKRKFFDNGATPNMIVKHGQNVTPKQAREFKAALDDEYAGTDNAYRTMHVGGGADVTVVGANFQQLDFQVVQSHGEPLALDTPIPTPTGWSTMGELQVGDEVIGRDGRPANVVGCSPIHHDRQCYRVTFHDGTSIVADAGHLWVAVDRYTRKRAESTYTTAELMELVNDRRPGWARRMSVPPTPALDLPEADLLVDPYVLGCWLGDGQTAGAAICGAADDLKFIADQIESRGYTTSQWTVRADRVPVIGIPGGLLSALDALGVLGNKSIPRSYMRGSIAQRLALLQGLMDTDGSIGHAGQATCEFTSKFEHLAQQFAELARSLGYRAPVSSKADSRSRTGRTWQVRFRADPDKMPFRLPRKVERVREWGAPHVRSRSILSIESTESVLVRCIAVDTEDHLFLAGETMVPTHNTRIAAAAGTPPVIVGLSKGLESSTYCLPYGAQVRTDQGHKSIGDVRPGDKVWSFDGTTLNLRAVTWQGAVGVKTLFRVEAGERVLRATGNHPVLTQDSAGGLTWREVDDLCVGDRIVHEATLLNEDDDALLAGLDPAKLGLVTVAMITQEPPETVYDITVDENHSFIADGVVVHNSNYSQARRRFADGTLHPLWGNAAGTLQRLRKPPPASRLWVDTRDVPFLREDSKDAAAIAETQARTMRTLVDGGYTPESVQRAVMSGDFGLLKHSGWYSVQLRPPGADDTADSASNEALPDI